MDVRRLLQLLSVPRIGPLKVRALLREFHDPASVLSASPRELVRVPGINRGLASAIAHHSVGASFADGQLRAAARAGVRIVSLWDEEYPDLLQRIYDPPPVIYVLGRIEPADGRAVALVGTRTPSPYGRRAAEEWTHALVLRGFTIVSGLARGIDTVVHSAALDAGGRTIAVIGSGLDIAYPPENRALLNRISERGAVLSEFPMGTKPDAQNFPRRNRIISGLALGTIVVESDEDGGAMITASLALDQNREVFAIPGSIFEQRTIGPHRLIQGGRAKLACRIEDVLEELGCSQDASRPARPARPPADLTLFEQAVFNALDSVPMHVDDIAERASTSPSDTLVTLLSLEFKGLIRQLPGKMFERLEPLA